MIHIGPRHAIDHKGKDSCDPLFDHKDSSLKTIQPWRGHLRRCDLFMVTNPTNDLLQVESTSMITIYSSDHQDFSCCWSRHYGRICGFSSLQDQLLNYSSLSMGVCIFQGELRNKSKNVDEVVVQPLASNDVVLNTQL